MVGLRGVGWNFMPVSPHTCTHPQALCLCPMHISSMQSHFQCCPLCTSLVPCASAPCTHPSHPPLSCPQVFLSGGSQMSVGGGDMSDSSVQVMDMASTIMLRGDASTYMSNGMVAALGSGAVIDGLGTLRCMAGVIGLTEAQVPYVLYTTVLQ